MPTVMLVSGARVLDPTYTCPRGAPRGSVRSREECIHRLHKRLSQYRRTLGLRSFLLVTGDCPYGPDAWAYELAVAMELDRSVYCADDGMVCGTMGAKRWQTEAASDSVYLQRDRSMARGVRACAVNGWNVIVEAFEADWSLSGGTAYTLRYLRGELCESMDAGKLPANYRADITVTRLQAHAVL